MRGSRKLAHARFNLNSTRRFTMNGNDGHRIMRLALAAFLIFSGCASYAPSLVRLDPSGPNVRKAMKGDLTIYVEEYATSEKSERAFDTSLAPEGVLAILVSVENNGREPYEVKGANFTIRRDKPLKALTPEEAATRAQRGAVGRALGWSLIVPIISIPIAVTASAIHTSNVNQQIVRDFAAKGFPDGAVMPNKERSGFLFFELQAGQKDLAGLVLELTTKNELRGETVTVNVPLPEATFTTVPATSQEGADESTRPRVE
jgi:hypothetical protein